MLLIKIPNEYHNHLSQTCTGYIDSVETIRDTDTLLSIEKYCNNKSLQYTHRSTVYTDFFSLSILWVSE